MIKIIKKATPNAATFLLRGAFEEKLPSDSLTIKKFGKITENTARFEATIFLGKHKEYQLEKLREALGAITSYGRAAQLDVESFTSSSVSAAQVVSLVTEAYLIKNAPLYSAKSKKPDAAHDLHLITSEASAKTAFATTSALTEARNYTRTLQMTPPNILNSEVFATQLAQDFAKLPNIKVKVLTKKDITNHKMGLLLAVNSGSAFEPRVVVLEYTGAPSRKDFTAIIGKGITYDAGGYNLKPSSGLIGMKFDMSGAAVVAGLFHAFATLKPKTNVTGVLAISDNKINSLAVTPDAVVIAMNGKSVEINNTDAEGRLVMADALTYAVQELKAPKLIDIATLTGAVIGALGHTYTGVWATQDADWVALEKAAHAADELVWRLPLHKDFGKFISESKVADLKNTDLTGKGGASSAAMFLTHFTDNKPYLHLDIAGTADANEMAHAPLIKTLYNLFAND